MYTNRSSYMSKKPSEAPALELSEAPNDTVADIAFNINSTAMAVASWDGTLSIYGVQSPSSYGPPQPNIRLISQPMALPAIPLSVCFLGEHVAVGCLDGSLLVIAAGTPGAAPIVLQGAHQAPIKRLRSYNQWLISASFDQTVRFWTLEDGIKQLHSIPLPAKAYDMSLAGSTLAVALSNNTIFIIDMTSPANTRTLPTKFRFSVRSVACGADNETLVAGSVDSRIEISSSKTDQKRFMVRAHKDNVTNSLYSVNVVGVDPMNSNTVVSGGADGTLVWMDKMNRMKTSVQTYQHPITAGAFSPDGRYFVFATGDDWSKGYTGSYVKPVLRVVDPKGMGSR